jgi:kinesin family protein 2/24
MGISRFPVVVVSILTVALQHVPPGHVKVCVAVRKRPINDRERAMRDYDAVTAMNPRVAVHSCKLKVDGITKYLENQLFEFDHVSWLGSSGRLTVFAKASPPTAANLP